MKLLITKNRLWNKGAQNPHRHDTKKLYGFEPECVTNNAYYYRKIITWIGSDYLMKKEEAS